MPCAAALVTDLIFRTKIDSTARAVGAAVRFAGSAADLQKLLAQADCDRVLIDLGHGEGLKSVDAVAQHAPKPWIVAFASHVDTDLIAAARRAGADKVMARSAFSAMIAELVQGEIKRDEGES